MNAAETYVDIYTSNFSTSDNESETQRSNRKIVERHTAWVSESGVMEFFLTASSNSFDKGPRRQVHKLALITGF